MHTAQQFESEWIDYHNSFQEIATESGIPLKQFFDLRGNHDKYGVPLHSPLDYYSKYSISAAFNRTSLVQSVIVKVLNSLFLNNLMHFNKCKDSHNCGSLFCFWL